MSHRTPDFIVQLAIAPAQQDRSSLAGCYDMDAPERTTLKDECKAIGTLKGKKLFSMNDDELALAERALIYAERWERNFAESVLNKGPYAAKARQSAEQFKRTRHALFDQKHDSDAHASVINSYPS